MSYHPPAASRDDTWTSPPDLVADVAWIAGVDGWDLDLAAAAAAAVAPRWWGSDHPDVRARDLLSDPALPGRLAARTAPWSAWCNPPYSRWGEFAAFAAAAHGAAGTVALVIFARTDTAAWHECVVGAGAVVAYRRGRVRFGGGPGAAPAPTVAAIYGRRRTDVGALVAPSGSQWWVAK